MRLTYLSAHAVRGIAHDRGQADVELFRDAERGVRVALTADPGTELYRLNRHMALMSMMFRGRLADPLPPDFEQQLHEEIDAILKRRTEAVGRDPVVVVEVTANVQEAEPTFTRDLGAYSISFDMINVQAEKARFAPTVAAVLSGLRLGSTQPVEYRQVSDGTYLTDANGRVIHSASVGLGRASLHVSTPMNSDQIAAASKHIALTLSARSLDRVIRLHAQSLRRMDDNYRSFLDAWTALEILVGKLFPLYQAKLVADLRRANSAPGLLTYLDRVSNVMSDKHRLTDKFAVLSVYLDDSGQDDEVETFRRLKQQRDQIAHGEEIDDSLLPTRDVHRLFDKYLRSHLDQ